MTKVKEFLATKKIGWYVSLASLVLGLICLICYTARGGNYLSPVNSWAVTFLVLALVTNALVLVKDFKVCAFIPMMLYAASFAVLLNTEMLFITNVGFGVDGNSFDSAFYAFVITDILAILASAVAFSMGLSKDKAEETVKE